MANKSGADFRGVASVSEELNVFSDTRAPCGMGARGG